MKLSLLLTLLLAGSGSAAVSTMDYGELGATAKTTSTAAVQSMSSTATQMYDSVRGRVMADGDLHQTTDVDATLDGEATVATDVTITNNDTAHVASDDEDSDVQSTDNVEASTNANASVDAHTNAAVDVDLLGSI